MNMGRPGTPGPADQQPPVRKKEKQTFILIVLFAGLASTVLAVVAVAVPKWGTFVPQSSQFAQRNTYYGNVYIEGSGYFGPFHHPCKYTAGGYSSFCDPSVPFKKEVYMTIAGICALVGLIATALFSINAGLHCAMKINNKKICLKYKTNIFVALIMAVLADLGSIGAVILAALQFNVRGTNFEIQVGACFIIEIILVIINLFLVGSTTFLYRRSKKDTFPVQRNPYEISGDRYQSPEPHQLGYDSGIVVTKNSGKPFQGGVAGGGAGQNAGPSRYDLASLPTYPAPSSAYLPAHGGTQGVVQSASGIQFMPGTGGQMGYYNEANTAANGSNGHLGSTGAPFIGSRAQNAEPQSRPVAHVQGRPAIPHRDELSLGVSLNPVGRTAAYNNLKGPGSMESLDSTKSSTLSFGSTGSAASINAPLRSSMKKPKNKEITSVSSNVSKKSVTIAIGAEQTAV